MNHAGYLRDGQQVWPQPRGSKARSGRSRGAGHSFEYLLATAILLMLIFAIMGI